MDKVALFDMDDTLADYTGQLKADLSLIGINHTPSFLDNASAIVENQMTLIKSQHGWWENLPPIESGMQLMKLCKDIGFRIAILTQGPYKNRSSWGEKFNWCDIYVKPIDQEYTMILTRDGKKPVDKKEMLCGKGLVYGRVFVDDYPPYMLSWLENRPRGLGLMPETSWNKDFKHPQVVKYNQDSTSFSQELKDRLQHAYSRKSFEN